MRKEKATLVLTVMLSSLVGASKKFNGFYLNLTATTRKMR